MPRLPDEPRFFARDPASDVLRSHRGAEDEAALRSLDSALLRRRAEFDARTLEEDDLEFGPLSGPPDATPSFDERVQDLIDPFAGSRVEARARSLLDTHRKAFEARNALAGHQRSDRRMVKTLERVLEDNKQAVALQPGLIDVALARADTALDKTATALEWSDDEREAHRAAFDKDLAQRLLRADIARGNARSVLQELVDDDLALDPETTANLRREAETAQGHARAAFQADADAAMDDADAAAGAALIAQADDILAEGEREAFVERVRQAQADTAFRTMIRFMTPEAIEAAIDRDVDPLEPLSAETRARRQVIARHILEARSQDPVRALMADTTVAGWFADGTPLEIALSRRLQVQREIGVAGPKVLPRDDARTMAAELNSMPPAARMARLVELTARYGKHHAAAFAELAAQGLDRPAQALAATQGHPALALALIDAQTVGRAKLREGLDPEEVDAIDTAISQALRGADTKGFRFVIEDLTFRTYRRTGDAELAAQDAVALARDALRIETSDKPDAGKPDNVALVQGPGTKADFDESQTGLEVPLSGAMGSQNDSPVKEELNAVVAFGQTFDKEARGLLGPAYKPSVALLRLVDAFSPKADVEDLIQFSRETKEGIVNLDAPRTIKAAAELGASFGMLFLPGSVSGAKSFVRSPETGGGPADGKFRRDIANMPPQQRAKVEGDPPEIPNSPEENMERGYQALGTVLRTGKADMAAMFRKDLGWIAFEPGEVAVKESGNVVGAGLRKIVIKHAEDLARLPEVIALGKISFVDTGKNRRSAIVDYDGYRAVFRMDRFGERETWLISHYFNTEGLELLR